MAIISIVSRLLGPIQKDALDAGANNHIYCLNHTQF